MSLTDTFLNLTTTRSGTLLGRKASIAEPLTLVSAHAIRRGALSMLGCKALFSAKPILHNNITILSSFILLSFQKAGENSTKLSNCKAHSTLTPYFIGY